MSDKSTTESDLEQQETQVVPTPVVPSIASGDQQTSGSKDDEAILERLLSKVDERLDRKMQSVKDKRIAELEKKLNTLLDDAPASEVPGRTKQVDQSGGEDQGLYMEAMTKQILSGADIAADDEEYVALVNEYQGKIFNQEQWVKVVREFASNKASKASKQSSVTPAAMSSSGGSTTVVSKDAEAVASELRAIQRGPNSRSPENLAKRKELLARLNELDPMVSLDDPNVVTDTSALHKAF